MAFSEVGLLQGVASIIGGGHRIYFCFLHLSDSRSTSSSSHLSHVSQETKSQCLRSCLATHGSAQCSSFMLVSLNIRTSRPWLSKLPRFLRPVPASVYDLVREVTKKAEKPLLVSLLHCLYESEDPSLCAFVAGLLDHTLDLSGTTLSPLDCLSVGNFLSVVSTTVSGEFVVDLYSSSIGDQGCEFLVRGLCKCSQYSLPNHLTI